MFSSGSEPDCSTLFTVQLPQSTSDFLVCHTPKSKEHYFFFILDGGLEHFLAVCIDYMPSRAPSLIAYQCIITSANHLYPLESWLNYDVQFQTLAASNPTLRWDTHYPDLWLQCCTPLSAQKSLTSSGTQKSRRWSCPHCGAVTHYPDHCNFRPSPSKQIVNRQWNANRGQSDSQPSSNPTFSQHPVPTNPNQGCCFDYNISTCNRQYCRFVHRC